MDPRWPQDGPKRAQDGPKEAQDGSKMFFEKNGHFQDAVQEQKNADFP